MKTVYLAGPIAGCTKGEANDWRGEVVRRFSANIRGISPLRCEPLVGERYELAYNDPRFGTATAIAGKNNFDVRNCDLVLAYLPRELNERRPSYGTILELGWAMTLSKSIILVTNDPYLQKHPLITSNINWLLSNFDDAVDVVNGILGDYAG